jgi:hypothetical protein
MMLKTLREIRVKLDDRVKAYARFALTLALLSLGALIGVILLTAYTVRMDIAFMEANQMLKNELIRSDIMREAFSYDGFFPSLILLGILANSAIAGIFGVSQEHYFSRFRKELEQFAETLQFQKPRQLGPLQDSVEDFIHLISIRKQEGESERFKDLRNKLLSLWPKGIRVYLLDQVQFAVIAGGLAAYYSALCMMIFWHANSKIVILTSQMTQIKTVNAASFFDFQFSISENIGWTFTILVTLTSCIAGVKFSRKTYLAAYAIRRQLRLFLEGNLSARLSLRSGDPGLTEIKALNATLDKIERSIRNTGSFVVREKPDEKGPEEV